MHLLGLKPRQNNGLLFQVFRELGEEIETLVEHFDEEGIALADGEQFVCLTEKEVIVLRSEQDDRPPVRQLQRKNRTVLVIAPFHEGRRVAQELKRVPKNGKAAARHGRKCVLCHQCPP